MLFENVEICNIDGKDDLFRLESIDDKPFEWNGSHPPYNPVWLHQTGPSTFRIVDGFKIVDRAKQVSHLDTVPAMIFHEDSSLTWLWKLRLQKRELEGNLSTIAYLRSLSRLMDKMQLHEYPGNEENIYFPADIGQQAFKRDTLNAMLEKSHRYDSFTELHQLTFKILRRLEEKPAREISDLAILLNGLKLKGKKLTSLLELIAELDRGFGISLEDLLKDKTLMTIQAETPVHQRYRLIKSRLLMLRFPQLNQLVSDWDKSLKQTGLDGVVEIRHDPYFEDDFLQFVFSPRNALELRQQLEKVLEKTGSSELDDLFNFI